MKNTTKPKRQFSGGKGSAKDQAPTRKEIVNIVKSISHQDVEKKWLNYATLTTFSATPTYLDMTSLSVGSSITTRIGNQIKVKDFEIRWQATVADSSNLIRVLLVEWKMDDTVMACDYARILTDTSSGQRAVHAPFVPTVPSIFKIHMDLRISVDAFHPVRVGYEKLKLNISSQYAPGVNSGKNHVYLIIFSDSAAVAHPEFDYEVLFRFEDD